MSTCEHDWQPMQGWTGRYGCRSCGAIGYRKLVDGTSFDSKVNERILAYRCAHYSWDGERHHQCPNDAKYRTQGQLCEEHEQQRQQRVAERDERQRAKRQAEKERRALRDARDKERLAKKNTP